jgi:hypothetical protein
VVHLCVQAFRSLSLEIFARTELGSFTATFVIEAANGEWRRFADAHIRR